MDLTESQLDLTEYQRILPSAVDTIVGAQERCGFVVIDEGFFWFYEVPNRAKEPEKTFEIAAEDYYPFAISGRVIGVWHSHPRGHTTPSALDWEWHPDPRLLLFIVAD